MDESSSLEQIKLLYQNQRTFFDAGGTKNYAFRLNALSKLKSVLFSVNEEIKEALYADFKKPSFETYLSDIGVVTDELNHTIKNLRNWMKPKNVSTPLSLFPAYSTKLYLEPKGVVMIFSPWNYPVNLALIPLISAVAAGNTVILKPAHETNHTAILLHEIIKQAFDEKHVSVIIGEGKIIGPMLLDNLRFDHIFFTGSPNVGRYMMTKAAENLTPITLELGGKSPVIVDKNINLKTSVNRIIWGKLFNAGQTCIAPDYVLVHEEIKEKFVEVFKQRLFELFGDNPQSSPYFARIISDQRFEKLISYLDEKNIIVGGQFDAKDKYIAPTLIEVENLDSPIMKEEIFGPILPIVTWNNKEDLTKIIRLNRYPLACYIYSNNQKLIEYIIDNIEFGSGCINDNMVQFANKAIPFGGIQFSGMGRYHGRHSFETFSNTKGIVKTPLWLDHNLKYPPYTEWKEKIAKLFLN